MHHIRRSLVCRMTIMKVSCGSCRRLKWRRGKKWKATRVIWQFFCCFCFLLRSKFFHSIFLSMWLSRWRPMSCSADVAQVSQLSALPAPSLYEKEHNMKNNSEKFFFFRVCVSSRRDFFGSAVKTLWNNIEWRAKSLMEFQRHLPWRAIGESLWKWDLDWTWLVSRSHLSRLWNVYAYANQIWTSLSCVYIACEHCQSVQLSSLNWDFTPFSSSDMWAAHKL